MSEIVEIEMKEIKIVGLRRKGAYSDVAILLPELFQKMTSAGIKMAGPPMYICHEMTMEEVERAMKENNADLEVAIPVAGRIPARSDLKPNTLPGAKMAKIVHKGPYEKVGETYTKLFEWMAQNGKQAKGPYREIYLNNPMEVPPEELLTEIHAPI